MNFGDIRTFTPEQISQYRSQWMRYEKALDIVPSQLKYAKTEKGLLLDVRFYNEPQPNEVNQNFDYRITARLINTNNVRVYEDQLAEAIDGRPVRSLGQYFFLEGEERVSILEGNYVVVDKSGKTIGVLAANGSVVPIQQELFRYALNTGDTFGYRCTCVDYLGQTDTLLQGAKQWRNIGSLGLCKHIMAVKLLRREQLATPTDIPMVAEKTSTPQLNVSTTGRRRGKIKEWR